MLNSFNLGQFKNEHFTQNKVQYYLNKEYNRDYNAILMQAIIEHKQAIFIYLRECYRLFMKLNKVNAEMSFPKFDLFAKEKGEE